MDNIGNIVGLIIVFGALGLLVWGFSRPKAQAGGTVGAESLASTQTVSLLSSDNQTRFHALYVLGPDGATYVAAQPGAANPPATGQVALSGSAAVVVAARATRRGVVIKNMDAAITVYVGTADVTSSTGLPLKAGESVAIDSAAAIYGVAASATPSVAFLETYD